MNRFFAIGILLALLVFSSCETDNSISFINQNIATNTCESCPKISIDIPQAQPENEISKRINSEIDTFVTSTLNYSEEKTTDSILEAVAIFNTEYKKLKERFPEDIIPWEATIKGNVSFENNFFTSVAIESYIFTGGAHGYGSISFLNFDTKTGKNLTPNDLFKDKQTLIDIAEKEFRTAQKIKPDANINSTGFMFENDAFHLPSSIGFNEKGLVLIYNPYEIASYADGRTTIEIPFETAKQFMKPEWLSEVH
ncbi:DUF3298 and DUF4163 domain-containing protein [Joostella sp. CR20]|uniref:DUF3298 and DUF4163 domain-containing protein n=1 Tax=Joostella sp. CR20 TaxID=2804312 RepID=UPI00313D35C7